MPRVARVVIPECPHHITQRGNNRQDVFFVDDDRRVYLDLLREQSARFGLRIEGYCLMTNHVHLIAVPAKESALAQAVGRTHFLYTQYVNRLHGRSGHLWQNRFFSCALDDKQYWLAMAYVERNPVRAGMVRQAWLYDWSSAAAHCGLAMRTPLPDMQRWSQQADPDQWRNNLIATPDDKILRNLRANTNTGRPLGSDSFLAKLETKLGRRLRPLPIGRPNKSKNKKGN